MADAYLECAEGQSTIDAGRCGKSLLREEFTRLLDQFQRGERAQHLLILHHVGDETADAHTTRVALCSQGIILQRGCAYGTFTFESESLVQHVASLFQGCAADTGIVGDAHFGTSRDGTHNVQNTFA